MMLSCQLSVSMMSPRFHDTPFPHIPAVRRCQALGLGGFESGCHQDPSPLTEPQLLPILRGKVWLCAGLFCYILIPWGIWGAGRSPGRINAALSSCSLTQLLQRKMKAATLCLTLLVHGHIWLAHVELRSAVLMASVLCDTELRHSLCRANTSVLEEVTLFFLFFMQLKYEEGV